MGVMEYKDPQVVSYTILEDRTKMEEPINLEEMNFKFYFSLYGPDNTPTRLEERIGRFKLT